MNRLFLLLFLIIPLVTISQAIDSVSVYYYKTNIIKETYTVLKSNEKIKHGTCTYYNRNLSKDKSGEYENGERVGEWFTYKNENDARIIKRFNHDDNSHLEPFIDVRLNYPHSAKENNIEGEVTVKYFVCSDCTISNIEIVKGLTEDCDNEIIRVIKRLGELQVKYSVGKCEEKQQEKTFNFKLM